MFRKLAFLALHLNMLRLPPQIQTLPQTNRLLLTPPQIAHRLPIHLHALTKLLIIILHHNPINKQIKIPF
jgi:hypothetical protein